MRFSHRSLIVLFLFIVLLPLQNTLSIQKSKPKLVVGIVVDQMRYDYLTRFEQFYGNDGFKRLMNEGSNFTFAHFNYVPTFTGPGHSSIYTGTTPYYHGIIANNWYNKYQKKMIYCTDDSSVITVGAEDREGKMSPRRLMANTITDQFKIETNGSSKVIAISIKDRAAILPGGHMADAAYWYDSNNGNFITSSYYMKNLPSWVQEFNRRKLVDKYMNEVWSLTQAERNYNLSEPDEEAYEKDVFKEGKTSFPHSFTSLRNKDKYSLLRSTPFGNQLLLDFAEATLKNEKLGKHNSTDFLAISFSSTDYIGHYYGPNSMEIEDTYIRLDRQIGELLKALDNQVGKGNYLLFLTADHGVAEVMDYMQQHKLPTGQLGYKRALDSLRAFTLRTYGDKNILSSFSNYQIFLNHQLLKEKGFELTSVRKNYADYLRETFPSITTIYTRDRLENETPSRTSRNLVLNGFNLIRSGDIAFELRPNYFLNHSGADATTHGTSYAYDTHVPLIFYGWNVPAQKINKPVFTVDISATIASMLGYDEPNGNMGIPIIK